MDDFKRRKFESDLLKNANMRDITERRDLAIYLQSPQIRELSARLLDDLWIFCDENHLRTDNYVGSLKAILLFTVGPNYINGEYLLSLNK